MNQNLIFLDIDGVLNDHTYYPSESTSLESKSVDLFNKIIDKVDPKIVISSAWRYMITGGAMTIKGFEYLLRTHNINVKDRIIGYTESDEKWNVSRGEQIELWRQINHKYYDGEYCVIDDLDLDISRLHPFVKTNGLGLSTANYYQTLSIFGFYDTGYLHEKD